MPANQRQPNQQVHTRYCMSRSLCGSRRHYQRLVERQREHRNGDSTQVKCKQSKHKPSSNIELKITVRAQFKQGKNKPSNASTRHQRQHREYKHCNEQYIDSQVKTARVPSLKLSRTPAAQERAFESPPEAGTSRKYAELNVSNSREEKTLQVSSASYKSSQSSIS